MFCGGGSALFVLALEKGKHMSRAAKAAAIALSMAFTGITMCERNGRDEMGTKSPAS
jgi:hypothetical protein